jgi:hypothetical protein
VDLGAYRRQARLVVPDRSIGVLRIGMTLGQVLAQGASKSGLTFVPQRKLTIPTSAFVAPTYEVDDVLAVLRGGRVRALFTRGADDRRDDYRTAAGLTTRSSPLRSVLRRLAAGGSCRPLAVRRSLSDLCRLGRSTFWGPGGGGAIADGFFTIWPGVRPR